VARVNHAWRLKGCYGGNKLSFTGDENHVRIWHQPVPGSADGAWFVTASYEMACVAIHGKLKPFQAPDGSHRIHLSFYHCVDGGPGSYHAKHPNGYDDGAEDFAADVARAARSQGWGFSQRDTTRPNIPGKDTDEDGVKFNNKVYVLTVTSKHPTVVAPVPTDGADEGAVLGPHGRIWIVAGEHFLFQAVDPVTRAIQTYEPSKNALVIDSPPPFDKEGNLWFSFLDESTVNYTEKIGRFDPRTGKFTKFGIPEACADVGGPFDFYSGTNGQIWMECEGDFTSLLERVAPNGKATPVKQSEDAPGLGNVVPGADGTMWAVGEENGFGPEPRQAWIPGFGEGRRLAVGV
jgi:hypothetical protein